MGSNASISMFNQSYWDETFIPAAYDLFSRGLGRPCIKEVMERDETPFNPDMRLIEKFKDRCSIMVDFAAIDAGRYSGRMDEEKPRKFSDADLSYRRCRDTDCKSNDHCPFYVQDMMVVQEDYGYFFIELINSFLDNDHQYIYLGGRSTASHAPLVSLILPLYKGRNDEQSV